MIKISEETRKEAFSEFESQVNGKTQDEILYFITEQTNKIKESDPVLYEIIEEYCSVAVGNIIEKKGDDVGRLIDYHISVIMVLIYNVFKTEINKLSQKQNKYSNN